MKQYILLVLTVILLFACNKKKDDVYIPRDKFIAVLTDIHLADSYYNTDYEGRKTHSDSINLYNTVFNNHGVTKAQFDTTLKLYALNSQTFDQVYEEVITRLNKLEQVSRLDHPMGDSQPENIWYGKNLWLMPKEGPHRKIPVDLKLKGKGKYEVTFTYKLYSDDGSKNPRLNLYFSTDSSSAPKTDTLRMVNYTKDALTTVVTVTKELKDTTFTRLRGYLFDHDEKRGQWQKHAVIGDLKVYFTPSPK